MDFFQPLENLRCQSLANFFLRDPDTVQKEINKINDGQEPADSLVEIICSGMPETRLSLVKENWVRSIGEPCYDLHFNNLLNHAFNDEKTLTSLKILVEHILELDTSTSLNRIMSSNVPQLLAHDDDFECFKDYFIALNPEAMNSKEPSNDTTFVTHLNNELLPRYSDEDVFMDKFNTGDLMRSEMVDKSNKMILDRFEEFEDKQMNTHVEHFSVHFKAQILKAKIEQFNDEEPLTGHPFTDLELAEMLDKIVNKYDY